MAMLDSTPHLLLVRQEHQHGQPVPREGQLQDGAVEVLVVGVLEHPCLVHHVHLDHLAGGDVELPPLRPIDVEALLPPAPEVDGAPHHELGILVDRVRGEELLHLARRVGLGPQIYVLAGGVGVGPVNAVSQSTSDRIH